jgi:hypothetical protein
MQTMLNFDRVFGALADATRRDVVRRAIAGTEGIAEMAGHYPIASRPYRNTSRSWNGPGWSARCVSGAAR